MSPLRLAASGLLALGSSAALAQAGPDLAVAAKAASCNACHGPYGRSEAGIPPLAGRDPQQMYTMLLAFKSSERSAFVMHHHAKGYSDQELRDIASYFGRQKPQGDRK